MSFKYSLLSHKKGKKAKQNNAKSGQKSGGLSDHHFLKSGGPAENPVASGDHR